MAEAKNFLCNRCDSRFLTPGDLKKHLHTRKILCVRLCENCGMTFKTPIFYISSFGILEITN